MSQPPVQPPIQESTAAKPVAHPAILKEISAQAITSVVVAVIGFSTSTCVPRSRQCVARSKCAGVGTASDVTVAMELGVDGVLLNTGIAHARDPLKQPPVPPRLEIEVLDPGVDSLGNPAVLVKPRHEAKKFRKETSSNRWKVSPSQGE